MDIAQHLEPISYWFTLAPIPTSIGPNVVSSSAYVVRLKRITITGLLDHVGQRRALRFLAVVMIVNFVESTRFLPTKGISVL